MKITRRELIAGLFRLVAVGGLIGGVAVRLARRPARVLGDDACRAAGSCRECRWLARCGHPRALSARRVIGGGV